MTFSLSAMSCLLKLPINRVWNSEESPELQDEKKTCFQEMLKSNLQKFNTTGKFVVPITENYKNVIDLIDKLLVCR